MSVLDRIRPDLRDFSLYTAGDGDDSRVRLHANELPFRADNDDSARGLHRYPLGRDARLTQRLAELYDVTPDQVLATRGSDDAIDLIIRTFCIAGESSIVCTSPGFAMYPALARMQGCTTRSVALSAEQNFNVDIDEVIANVDDSVALVFLCSPNNPTGQALSLDDLRRVCAAISSRALVVVDEAYAEFSAVPSATALVPEFDNLVVLRTLSKAYGLASARVGAVVSQAPLVGVLDRLLMPFPLPAASVEAALTQTAPSRRTQLAQQWIAILAQRDALYASLRGHRYIDHVWPSDANFLLLRTPRAQRIVDHCHARGLLVRLIRTDGEAFVRLTVGQTEENQRFLAALAECGA